MYHRHKRLDLIRIQEFVRHRPVSSEYQHLGPKQWSYRWTQKLNGVFSRKQLITVWIKFQ
jgi:hypothetical protein